MFLGKQWWVYTLIEVFYPNTFNLIFSTLWKRPFGPPPKICHLDRNLIVGDLRSPKNFIRGLYVDWFKSYGRLKAALSNWKVPGLRKFFEHDINVRWRHPSVNDITPKKFGNLKKTIKMILNFPKKSEKFFHPISIFFFHFVQFLMRISKNQTSPK